MRTIKRKYLFWTINNRIPKFTVRDARRTSPSRQVYTELDVIIWGWEQRLSKPLASKSQVGTPQ